MEVERADMDAAVAAPVPASGRVRPVVEGIRPQVDGGRFAAKAAVGDAVDVEADAFADGHDLLACELRYRHEDDRRWEHTAMRPLGNDRWRATMDVSRAGRYRYCVRAFVDRFGTWRRDLAARLDAGDDVAVELLVGAGLLEAAAARAGGTERQALTDLADRLRSAPELGRPPAGAPGRVGSPTLGEEVFADGVAEMAGRHRDPEDAETSAILTLVVDPPRARFSTWYELFPRSSSPDPSRPGTLADVQGRLGYVAELGFDVLYLPPIHPIGRTDRKGRNGGAAGPGDPGSPWAIGSREGGHTAVDPGLGTIDDFDRLVAAAAERGIDVALDLAFQCSPDHPWVREHPDWFAHRPDGSVRYAENPPKKYQDIYPLDFSTASWRALWHELLGVVQFWINHGVRVFRVDNPHTKPFRFWEWLIGTVKAEDPEVVFLAEAFTRPRVMERLAKLGFTQSYTYFAWRTAKWEIEEYLTELTRTARKDYFRPNFWPNTPDILTETLQTGGATALRMRLVLAATLAANYGIYGPAFELGEHVPRAPGSEEYLDSEKYEIRHWDVGRPDSLAPFIGRVNAIRHHNRALQSDHSLRFHHVDNDQLLVYSKVSGVGGPPTEGTDGAGANVMLMVVNLDPVHPQSGWLDLDLGALGVAPDGPFEVHDLLGGDRYSWEGPRNFVLLRPDVTPAHILRVGPSAPSPAAGRVR
jgi:starch synthase (maltosyl-transferring)